MTTRMVSQKDNKKMRRRMAIRIRMIKECPFELTWRPQTNNIGVPYRRLRGLDTFSLNACARPAPCGGRTLVGPFPKMSVPSRYKNRKSPDLGRTASQLRCRCSSHRCARRRRRGMRTNCPWVAWVACVTLVHRHACRHARRHMCAGLKFV